MKLSIYCTCLFIVLFILFPVSSFATDNTATDSTDKKSVHKHSYSKGEFTLRSPKTAEEWGTYHDIRRTEIYDRYCPGKVYSYTNQEEDLANNFRFVFLENLETTPQVIGVIRVDLLPNKNEASLRWVAITSAFQKLGHGRRMVELAESFIQSRGRNLVRVPAEKESQGFYEKLGYSLKPWPEGPNHPGEVSMFKKIIKSHSISNE